MYKPDSSKRSTRLLSKIPLKKFLTVRTLKSHGTPTGNTSGHHISI